MTPNDIKRLVVNDVVRMREQNLAFSKTTSYQMGKANGMLKAFWVAGLLTVSEWTSIYNEILEEMF